MSGLASGLTARGWFANRLGRGDRLKLADDRIGLDTRRRSGEEIAGVAKYPDRDRQRLEPVHREADTEAVQRRQRD